MVIDGLDAERAPVTSGGPRCSFSRINGVDVGLRNLISKYGDDTKIGSSVHTDED